MCVPGPVGCILNRMSNISTGQRMLFERIDFLEYVTDTLEVSGKKISKGVRTYLACLRQRV